MVKYIYLAVFCLVSATSYGSTVTDVSICDPVNDRRLVLESNNALPVNIQDQHSRIVRGCFSKIVGSIMTLSAPASVGDKTVVMTAGHTFVAGDQIRIMESSEAYAGVVVGVSTNTLTLDAPLDNDFTVAAIVAEAVVNMAVDGSGTTQEFRIHVSSKAEYSVDITSIHICLADAAAMDNGTFGGIAALTNGIVFVVSDANGTRNLWVAKTNGQIGMAVGSCPVYSDKAPSGENAVHTNWAVAQNFGVAIRLGPGHSVTILVQDDLTGNTTFRAGVSGHRVSD